MKKPILSRGDNIRYESNNIYRSPLAITTKVHQLLAGNDIAKGVGLVYVFI